MTSLLAGPIGLVCTGFGPDEQEYLAKNAVDFHRFESGAFTAFSNIWLNTIWQQHLLYWPPKDCSDKGLTEHHKHVQLALQWLFDTLDPITHEQELVHTATHKPIVHPPGPTKIWQLTPPTTQEIAKSKAVHAAKYAVRVHLHWWRDYEEYRAQCLTCNIVRLFGSELDNELPWQPMLNELVPLMAVLHNPKPKPKVKQCHVGWDSHSIKLYADTTDVPPAHHHHHHHSWSFAGPSTASLSVKHGFVQLPVSPKKRRATAAGDFHDLLELLPGSDNADDQDSLAPHEEYHLDPEAYSLAMASDIEDIATAPRQRIYMYNPVLMFSSRVDGDGRLFCKVCIVSLHVACPTHVVQGWNGSYFDKVSLRDLGMQYQVRHLAGEICPHPRPAFESTMSPWTSVPACGNVHSPCSCKAHGFSLAMDTEPCTAIMTMALEQFQMLTFMGKILAYEYYHSLDNFDAFIRVVCEWSFIRLLKRAGVGNDHGGWKAAKPGSCAVECLACPHPGINIPDYVDPEGPNTWEHTLYIGMDANFRLERFNISSEDKDPGLSKGLAYFSSTNESSNLRAHAATTKPQNVTKEAVSEPEIWQPADQVEMDFGYLTAVRHFAGVPHIVMSYDIACQWSINLEERISIYGDSMQPNIPKKDFQEKYCMSFHIHVGENDGEAPECSWAISNGVAASTREMGPGHRCEKLDQHFGDFNWQKNMSQGDMLLCKIKDAVPKASDHEDQFKCFTASLPQDDIVKWTKMVEDWEVDRMKPNPFAWTVASKMEAAMRLQLAQEDAQDEMAGLDGDALHTTLPKAMISQGIQLELSQKRLTILSTELGEWGRQAQLRILEDSDVCRIADDEVACPGSGICRIWETCPEVSKNVCESNGVRLVPEHIDGVEMDRVKRTLEHEANLWMLHAKSMAEGAALINAGEGAGAYAKCQAAIRTSMRLSFEEKWQFIGQWLELGETGDALARIEDILTID
ncbi:hypothetical protein EDD18DRAFT_1108187 [Armillaria luteobubalina]|uniref:CxC2-like cysteine cluster KDZ transposase-associated domain-containing protein n=1 Tax=Armillaria luteobubalina TaxID=153913 RepID=A0AA39UKR7_9AGAR|nr:hypothetical protein EDD18DRAFT_1108187 [Armillaria luteobubalina]